jgi:hypothetical protein
VFLDRSRLLLLSHVHFLVIVVSADSQVLLHRLKLHSGLLSVPTVGGMGQGGRLRWVHFVFLCCIPIVDLQINLFRPNPSHSTTESQFLRFCVKDFQLIRHCWGARKKEKNSRGPNPLSVAMMVLFRKWNSTHKVQRGSGAPLLLLRKFETRINVGGGGMRIYAWRLRWKITILARNKGAALYVVTTLHLI